MQATLWSPTKPNLSFAGFSNKFQKRLKYKRGLSIKAFTEFAGPAIRMFLWLPLSISRSVLTLQENAETVIWFREQKSFVQKSHCRWHCSAHVTLAVIHQLFVLIYFCHLVGCSNDFSQILFRTVTNIVRNIGLTGDSPYFSGGK